MCLVYDLKLDTVLRLRYNSNNNSNNTIMQWESLQWRLTSLKNVLQLVMSVVNSYTNRETGRRLNVETLSNVLMSFVRLCN